MKAKHELEIVMVPIKDLVPYEKNARKWSKTATAGLRESITRFGQVDALLVNNAPGRENIVLGGSFRLSIMKTLGYTEVAVIYLGISDPAKEAELNLRLNKNSGDWDYDLLKNFDINLLKDIGFEKTELSEVWDGLLEVENDDFDPDIEAKKINQPKTQVGDCYLLGSHKLICGDSTDPLVINRLVDGTKMNMIYTDPVYNINLDYDKGFGSKSKYMGTVEDDRSEVDYADLLRATIRNGLAVADNNSHIFYYCDQRYIGLLQSLYSESGIENKRVCLWVKNSQNPTPQVAFNKAYEPCIYGTIGSPYLAPIHNYTEVMNKEVGTGNSGLEDIMDIFDLWLIKRDPTSGYQHPTSKPPTLHEKALKRCTRPNSSVLDMFAGGGSTMVACESLERKCFMVELDPVFCDVIVKRYEKLTGKKAVRAT